MMKPPAPCPTHGEITEKQLQRDMTIFQLVISIHIEAYEMCPHTAMLALLAVAIDGHSFVGDRDLEADLEWAKNFVATRRAGGEAH